MLVLTRKRDESVVVEGINGGDRQITVRVLEIRGGTVRLGFDAPAEVAVHRLEVAERLQNQNAGVNGAGVSGEAVGAANGRVPPAAAEGARETRVRRQR